MKKKWIGPPNPGPDGEDLGHEVNVAGRYVGNVKPGDVLEVPDELCAGTDDNPAPVWAGSLWEDVKSPAKKKGEDQ